MVVRKKDTGKLYAMKTLSKQKIKKDNKVENILNERRILERVSHPFIIQMKYAFQNVSAEYWLFNCWSTRILNKECFP